MIKNLKKGDEVEWMTSQGKTHGTVVKKQTSNTHVKRHKVAASKGSPQYMVRSDKSGKQARTSPQS